MDIEPPPTLASGYGTLGEDDFDKNPVKILDDHEKRVKHWLNRANPYTLKAAVDTCYSHLYFNRFKRDLWDQSQDHKFGDQPLGDVLQFDLWLKKLEISESKTTSTGSPAAPAATPSPPAVEKPKPANSGSSDMAITPPPNPEAYQNYWNKYKRKNADDFVKDGTESVSTTTPSPAPSSTPSPAESGLSSGITPDCKRKLSLEGWLISIFCFSNQQVLTRFKHDSNDHGLMWENHLQKGVTINML